MKRIPDFREIQKTYCPRVVGENGEQEKHTFFKSDPEVFEALEFLRTHANMRKTGFQNFIQLQNL